jgi:spore coat polysaccharide biosynthesis protein SpsF
MKRVAIIQARMGSTRLPGKVLLDIGEQTMLARVVNRVRCAKTVDAIVVATTTSERDDAIVEYARTLGVKAFRGDEDDVLSRYYLAAKAYNAGMVARVTADCPLIDPEIIDKVVMAFLDAYPKVDFASNTLARTYPRGLDAEVASFAALERSWREAEKAYQRIHVFPYIYENPDKFNLISVTDGGDHSLMRWTVDTKEDLEFVRAVYKRLGNNNGMSWREVLAVLAREPELLEINKHVRQKQVGEG